MADTYNVNGIIYIIDASNNATVTGCDTETISLTSALKSTTADISFQLPPGPEYKITIVTLTIPSTVDISNTTYNVTTIGDNAFDKREDLTIIIIPDSVIIIGNNAFSGCTSLISVVIIGNSVTTIGDNAFTGCSSLASITLPYSVITIGDRVFSHCVGLTSIIIPNLNTTIGINTFDGCTSLARFYKI
jgi:hypothetical protein